MTPSHDPEVPTTEFSAAEIFLRRTRGPWTAHDQADYETRLANDPEFADATRRVDRSWQAVGVHAESPELMAFREQALARVRKANAKRWLIKPSPDTRMWRRLAVAAALVLTVGVAFQFSPYGYRPGLYRTAVGEQRVIELSDNSRIALDARTRLRERYTDARRTIELLDGQAQFTVAKDPARPFKVIAGDHTIIALGTVFTVEYVDREVHVAMLEGKVEVTAKKLDVKAAGQGAGRNSVPSPTQLVAGEELRVRRDGKATVNEKADLEAATAWRQGKVIFHDEPLAEAVRRVNRYSRVQLAVDDPILAALKINGVFETGDTQGFADALEQYLPVAVERSADTIRIRGK